MTAAVQASPHNPAMTARIGAFIILGVMLGAFMESLAGTALSFARIDMFGDLYTTPDEFAWLDFLYVASKIIGFMMVPWLFACVKPVRCLRNAVFIMAVSCIVMACLRDFRLVSVCRIIQGFAGGVVLVVVYFIFPIIRFPYWIIQRHWQAPC